jgi:localization factor PodJL
MNTRRSYIESLNAGRQRREHASLEDLNRSLASLDARFSRGLREDGNEDAAPRGAPGPAATGAGRDFPRNPAAGGGVASIGRIASELNSLREELHRRVEGASRSPERSETVASGRPETGGAGPGRPRGSAGFLSERPAGADIDALHREMAAMRGAVDALAREETVQSVGRRFDAVEARLSSAGDGMIAGVADRLDRIHAAVASLPDSLAIDSLDEKMRTLATAMEHVARQKEIPGAATFAAIEERLDEISRAIVASSAQPASSLHSEHLARIEARITSLSRQLEELVEDRPVDALVKQLNLLSARIEDIAGRAEMPDGAVDRLSRQIELIAQRLEEGAPAFDPGIVLRDMEKRFDALTQALEQRHETAREQSVALFRDLEERLERYNQDALSTDTTIVEALNKRFSDLEDAISSLRGAEPQAMRALEERLNDVAERLGRHGDHAAAIDPGLVRSIESQVESLAAHLSQSGRGGPEFDDIGPRLELIERSLMESREAIVVAAREAAENAVRSHNLPEGDAAVLSGLAEELQSLEKLARSSDERNARTFEAIHDTLLQIVERLGALENVASSSAPVAEAAPARKLEFAEAPSLDLEEAAPLVDASVALPKAEVVRDPKRSPAEAAAAAAMAALSSSEPAEPRSKASPKKSRLGKLSKALSRRKSSGDPVEERREPTADAAETPAPEVGLDAPLDPRLANQPLEPGSGAPDINAIMRRVRDERSDEGRARDAEAAKSDFIAAARRAAQAAAAEAEVLKKKSDPKGPSRGFSLKRLLRSNAKIMVLAAGIVLVGVAGTQLGKALLNENGHKTAVAKPKPVASTGVAAPKSETAAKTAAPKQEAAKSVAAMSPVTPLPARSAVNEQLAAAPVVRTDVPPSAAGGPVAPVVAAPAPSRPSVEAASTASPPVTNKAVPAAAPGDTLASAAADEKVLQAGGAGPKSASADPDGSSAPAIRPDGAIDGPKAVSSAAPDKAAEAPVAKIPVPDEAGPLPLREAAEGGDPKALFEIGTRYADGRGVAPDMKGAAKWYERSAELGFAPAEYRIGNFYEKGIGVERDIAKAEEWYKKAAGQGNAAAMHNLGVLYAMGADGPVDNETAVNWFEKAAELGVKDSQFNLGILAAKGVGMPQSLEESYKWFALVAKTGDKDAAAKRDEIANSLRPEQLQKARAAVELWKAKPVDTAANIVDIPDSWRESDAQTASIDMKQAVRNIQLILNKNGYDAGSPDGVMGARTKSAIADFQKANGMEPTGEVNEALVTALLKKK